MKCASVVCLLWALVLFPMPALADWSENFDSYALGSGLHGQGGWHGWDNNPAADAFISNAYALSPPHSVSITGSADMVHEYQGYTSGVWIYTAWQYVPADFSGISYFILLNTYNNAGPYNWSCEVLFNSAGYVQSDFDGGQLPLITGRWVQIRVEIDLDADIQTFYYDNAVLYSKSWVEGVTGGGVVNIAAVDLYANGASPIYYDDMSLSPGGSTPTERMTWGRVKGFFR
jgi:hypothetical protein